MITFSKSGGEEMSKKINLEERKLKAIELFQMGREARLRNKPEEAVRCIREAMLLNDECGSHREYTRCINLLGITYADIGNESMAVDCYLDGLEYAHLYRVKGMSHLFYNNIGTRYQELGDWEKSLEYFLLAKKNMDEDGIENLEAGSSWALVTYLNLGLVYFNMEQQDLSEYYIKLAKEQQEIRNNYEYEFPILVMLCKINYRKKNVECVKDSLPRLMELVKICEFSLGDYHQDVSELVYLLREMNDLENWKYVLQENDKIVNERKVMYFVLCAKGFWADYYKTIGDKESYQKACIEYATQLKKTKVADNKEKAAALNLKINLQKAENEIKLAELRSERDALTGLGNRYALQKQGQKMLRNIPEQKTLVAVGMLDLDFFKHVNDHYGHLQGDVVLKEIADILFDCFDGYGEIYRFGGDEYVAIIPQCTAAIINKLAGKVRRRVEDAHILNEKSTISDYLTLSQGYYACIVDENTDLDEMIDKADTILYEVKKHGKNGFRVAIKENCPNIEITGHEHFEMSNENEQ